MTLKKRSWQSPGFSQAGSHPVVCVSLTDARAYAAWLGQRDGAAYRLPTAAEWTSFAGGGSAAAACAGGGCSDEGTVDASSGPASAAGVKRLHGNIREWPAGCDAGCRRHPVLGAGWRDVSGRPSRDDEVDPQAGYDDVGFRLVRDVARDEVESL